MGPTKRKLPEQQPKHLSAKRAATTSKGPTTLQKKTEKTSIPDDGDLDDEISDDCEDLMATAMEMGSDGEEDVISDEEETDDENSDEDDGHYIEGDNEEEVDEQVSAKIANIVPSREAKTLGLYSAPTNDEIQGLKETGELFKSNLFKLQLDELLSEIKFDYEKAKTLDAALLKLRDLLDAVPDRPELLPNAAATALLAEQGIVVPFPNPPPPPNAQYTVSFRAPSSVRVVGSYAIKSVAVGKQKFGVDVAVEMPESLFQEKDHINHRYFYKRAYYLAVLAAELSKPKGGFPGAKIEFSTDVDDDARRPILVLHGSGDRSATDFSKLGCVIRIFPVVASTVFPAGRLAPGRNNVRPSTTEDNSSKSNTPTPLYNAAVLRDMNHANHLAHIYRHVKSCDALRDTFVMIKVWLYQRGLSQHAFIVQMITTYLLAGGAGASKKLATGFSSYQLLRGTMDFLASHDFALKPVFMGQTVDIGNEFSAEAFTKNYDVVIVDPSGRLNLAAWMSKSDLAELQHEAKLAMGFFDEVSVDRFGALFLQKVNQAETRYDNILRITPPSKNAPIYNTGARLDNACQVSFLRRKIPVLLQRGLTDRIKLVVARTAKLPSWPIKNSRPTREDQSIEVGLLLNPEHSSRVVDHGPPAEDVAGGEAFRRLWGSKSELRRFKDGRIVESVVWTCQDADDRALITSHAAMYLLERHTGVSPQGVHCWAGAVLSKQIRPAVPVPRQARLETPETISTGFQSVVKAYDAFAKQLTALEDLPLMVSTVSPACASLRYSSLFVPRPRDFTAWSAIPEAAKFIEPLEIILQFEGSTKWPDDIAAIKQMKVAFYLRLAAKLKETYPEMRVAVAAVQGEEEGYLDVAASTGFVFRIWIQQDREATLLERDILDAKTSHGRKARLQKALNAHQRRYTNAVMHTAHMQALCQHHPSLSGTIRLVKRWLSAHGVLGDTHVSEELSELLASIPYVDSAPYLPPASSQSGFLRVLRYLAEWDWKVEPVLVDLETDEGKGTWTASLRSEVARNFSALRAEEDTAIKAAALAGQKRGRRAWIVATPSDTHGKMWAGPSAIVAGRIRTLAKAATKCARDLVAGGKEKDVKRLFVHPSDAYDVLLHLNRARLPRHYEALDADAELVAGPRGPKYRNLAAGAAVEDDGSMPVVGWDPVAELLKDLRRTFSNLAFFFHDIYGGSVISIVWDPSVRIPQPWKVNLGFSSLPVGNSGTGDKKKKQVPHVVANLDAIVAEIGNLGDGIVEKVVVQKE